jgi:hypothetical protein
VRVLQVSPSHSENCGIAYFAEDLAHAMASADVVTSTVRDVPTKPPTDLADVILLHHHDELLTAGTVHRLSERFDGPVVLFAHSNGIIDALSAVDAVIAMAPGMLPATAIPSLLITHPAWTPSQVVTAENARRCLGLDPQVPTVGTCGFLKFDRQFDVLAEALLPHVTRLGWRIQILTSPWRMDSPGLLERLDEIAHSASGHLIVRHQYLPSERLVDHLQACDLLWCWTREPSSAYASGVASCLYSSGVRVVAADKAQHGHILDWPNVVRAPTELDSFVATLVAEMAGRNPARHDPDPVSWRHQVPRIRSFLRQIVAAHRSSFRQ